MTTINQKRVEKIYLEQVCKLLNKSWAIEREDESPDFILKEGIHIFGLEVREISVDEKVSLEKEIKELVDGYEKSTGIKVKFELLAYNCTGRLIDVIWPQLVSINFLDNKPIRKTVNGFMSEIIAEFQVTKQEKSEYLDCRKNKSSFMRKEESLRNSNLTKLKNKYEKKSGVSLNFTLINNINNLPWTDLEEKVLKILVDEDFESKPDGHSIKSSSDGIKFVATKQCTSQYNCLQDNIGYMNKNCNSVLQQAINEKSEKLEVYKKTLSNYKSRIGNLEGDLDIDLLLVANMTKNSGKLNFKESTTLNMKGFKALYVLRYPEELLIFDDKGNCQKVLKLHNCNS